MNSRIGIDYLSVFDLPPLDYVELVARLGCKGFSICLSPMGCKVHDYPSFSLRDDRVLRRDMVKAMSDHNVAMALGEGFAIRPGVNVEDYAMDLDVVCELGAPRINSFCQEPDLGRAFDQLATLAEMAGARGLQSSIEFVPGLPIGDLETAMAALDHVGNANCRLMVDAMHLIRSGATPADLAAVDPARIGYAQICDVPLVSPLSYMGEAMYERRVPGEGDLPLLDIVAALPRDIPLSLEVPRRSQALAGLTPFEYMEPCVRAAEALLSQLD